MIYTSISQLHSTKACSTLVLAGFDHKYGSYLFPNYEGKHPFTAKNCEMFTRQTKESGSFEEFCNELGIGITQYNISQKNYAGDWGLSIDQNAWIVASVQDEQGLVNKYLEQFGFASTNQRVYNTKNDTTVTFWLMTIPDFMEKCTEFGIAFEGPERKKGEKSFVNKKKSSKENSSELDL